MRRDIVIASCVIVIACLGIVRAADTPAKGKWKIYTKWPFDTKEAKRRQKETANGLGLPTSKTLDLGGGVKMDLVLIPAGEFLMGSKYTPEELYKRGGNFGTARVRDYFKREVPRHKVRITKPYYLGKTEVTQAQWAQVMGVDPSYCKGTANPVEQVSWNDCQTFVRKMKVLFKGKLTFRLPTEAEWEHACRAGTDTPFYFGEKITTDLANYNGELPWDRHKGKRRGKTTPVATFKSNPWRLHDMVGNVWEWCEDRYGAYAKKANTDPSGPKKGATRVLRGGAYLVLPGGCRSASRAHYPPTTRSLNNGLRVLVVVQP